MSRTDRFLKACRLEKADCTPVWLMRQAGRYMAAYRKVREKYSLLEMFKTPDIAAAVTLQPVQAYELDAAIVFADILLPLEGMGVGLEFLEKEGPRLPNPVRTAADVAKLAVPEPEEDLGYVLTCLRIVRAELADKVPLIGFAGAPFTLASYAIEGGSSRNFLRTKGMMYEHPALWNQLMEKLARRVASFLLAQARAGAQVVQLFDSWVGCLSPADYQEYVLPHARYVFQRLREADIPSIHFGTGTADLLTLMRAAGGDVVGVDWRTPIDVAWTRVGDGAGVQGNLDPVTLLAPRDVLVRKAGEILDRAGGRPGHIFNLGHGVLPGTPEDSVRALIDFVHQYEPGCSGSTSK
jgi:uroporphyrinogen decarboxylase